jgi:hypothetical protein
MSLADIPYDILYVVFDYSRSNVISSFYGIDDVLDKYIDNVCFLRKYEYMVKMFPRRFGLEHEYIKYADDHGYSSNMVMYVVMKAIEYKRSVSIVNEFEYNVLKYLRRKLPKSFSADIFPVVLSRWKSLFPLIKKSIDAIKDCMPNRMEELIGLVRYKHDMSQLINELFIYKLLKRRAKEIKHCKLCIFNEYGDILCQNMGIRIRSKEVTADSMFEIECKDKFLLVIPSKSALCGSNVCKNVNVFVRVKDNFVYNVYPYDNSCIDTWEKHICAKENMYASILDCKVYDAKPLLNISMDEVTTCKFPYKRYPFKHDYSATSIRDKILMGGSPGKSMSLHKKISERINDSYCPIQKEILGDIMGNSINSIFEYIERKYKEFGGWVNKDVVHLYGRLLAFLSIMSKDKRCMGNKYIKQGRVVVTGEIRRIFNERAIEKIYAVCGDVVYRQDTKVEVSKLSVALFCDGHIVDIKPFDNEINMDGNVTKRFLLNHFNKVVLALRKHIKFVKVWEFKDICDDDEIWKSESFSKLECVTKNDTKYYGAVRLMGIKCELPSLAKGIRDDTADEYVKKLISVKMKKESKCLLLKMLIPILYMSKRRRNKIRENKILDLMLKTKNMRRLRNP